MSTMSGSSVTTLISPSTTITSQNPPGPPPPPQASSSSSHHASAQRPRRTSSNQSAHGHGHGHGHAHGHVVHKRGQASHSSAHHAGSSAASASGNRRQSEGEHGRRAMAAGLAMQTLESGKPRRKGSGDHQRALKKSSRSDTNLPTLSRVASNASSSKSGNANTNAAKSTLVRRSSSRLSSHHSSSRQSSRNSSRHSSPHRPANRERKRSIVLDDKGREAGETGSDDDDWEEDEDGAGHGVSKTPKARTVSASKIKTRASGQTLATSGAAAGSGKADNSVDMRRTMSDSHAPPPTTLHPLTRTSTNNSAIVSGNSSDRPAAVTRKTTGFSGTQVNPDPSASTPSHALNDPTHVMPAHQIKHQQSVRSLHALNATDERKRAGSMGSDTRRHSGMSGLSRTDSEPGKDRPQVARAESALSMTLSRHATPAQTPTHTNPSSLEKKEGEGDVEAEVNSRGGQEGKSESVEQGDSAMAESAPQGDTKHTANTINPNDPAASQKQGQEDVEDEDDDEEVRYDPSDRIAKETEASANDPSRSPHFPFPALGAKGADVEQVGHVRPLSGSPEDIQRQPGSAPGPAGNGSEAREGTAEGQEALQKHARRTSSRGSRDREGRREKESGHGHGHGHGRDRDRDQHRSDRSPRRERKQFPPGPSQLSSTTHAASNSSSSNSQSRQTSDQPTPADPDSSTANNRSRQPSGRTLRHRYSNSSIRSIQSLRAPPHPLNSPTGYRSHMGMVGAAPALSPAKSKPPSMHYPPAAPPVINPEQAAGHSWDLLEEGEAGGATPRARGQGGRRQLAGQQQQQQQRQGASVGASSSAAQGRQQPNLPRSSSFASVRSITNILTGVSGSASNTPPASSTPPTTTTTASSSNTTTDTPNPTRRRTALEATSQASKYRTTSSAAEYHSSLGFPSTSAETAHLISRFLPPKKIRRPAWDISAEDMRAGRVGEGEGLTNGDYREAHESLVHTMRTLVGAGGSGAGRGGAGAGIGAGGASAGQRRGLTRSTSGYLYGASAGGTASGGSMVSPTNPLGIGLGLGSNRQQQYQGSGPGHQSSSTRPETNYSLNGAMGVGVLRGRMGMMSVVSGGWNGRTPFELSVDRCLAQRPAPLQRGWSGGAVPGVRD